MRKKINTITHLVVIVLVNERNCGNLSVIPFVFALYSRSFLLLLRQINETIILYKRMANVIKLRKGLDINLKGKAYQEFMSVKEPGFYALVPDDFTGITPKVVVKEQEYVMAGGPLFIDKNHPELKFVSPVSGVVTSVERGARRKVLNIVVEAAAEQDYEEFGKKDVNALNGESVKAALLEAGMFAFIRQRPYDVIADPTMYPKAIFVSAFDSNPLAPDFEFALKGEEANFQTGLDALSKMAKTYLSISVKQKAAALTQAKNVTITAFDGPNPAGNVGVQINHISPVVKGETVWTIGAEAVIFIGRLFNTGRVDMTRKVAVTGSEVLKPAYCKLKVGALLTNVFSGNVTTGRDLRYISGNVLTGKKVNPNGFLGAFDSQLTVIPEGDDIHEMLGWIMPRFNQFSVNHSYFSWLLGNNKEYVLDARIKGGERHMIMSNEYDKVFPMDIFPEYLVKAIIAGDIDRMEALGIYEVAPEDFALCEFVCSSKVEVQRIVRAGLDMLRAEMA
ncbi:NADH:ubiquinone oxidoreductase, Na(+)-translocating, A subunit [Bacteroides intestinalis DSM 17393]|uniref:Na(+)-translocating NADH-quinone reductase subunit A n=2 Tax=Bacteroides TaxID=816 RepID=B3CF06_9BACE|nr:NADH:ubiquinone oxidoreductase, Na(+)-translocating, A subunit [Bacteroides intestinalis DSM 17393]